MRTMLFSLLLLAIAGKIRCQFKATCPPPEAIRPCTCSIDAQKLPWLSCNGFKSLNQFVETAESLRGYAFSIMYLEKSNLGRLPADVFNGVSIRSLKITSANLTAMGDGKNRPPFIGLENIVEDIEIKQSFVDQQLPMKSFSLAHLKKLTLFQSSGNIAPTIPNDWFESGPYGLRQLLFEGSSTTRLGSHAFSSLLNLKEISVTGGSIAQVTRAMFPKPASHLTSIDLSNNALSTLPADMFRWMPSLEEIYLDSNAFTEIVELAWSTVWNQVTHVYFFGNPINCDEPIKWIYKYRLPEVLGGTCVSPDRLKGKELQKLTLKDFA